MLALVRIWNNVGVLEFLASQDFLEAETRGAVAEDVGIVELIVLSALNDDCSCSFLWDCGSCA